LKRDLSISVVGTLAAEVVSEAVVRAAKMASSIEGWPAYRDFTAKLPWPDASRNHKSLGLLAVVRKWLP